MISVGISFGLLIIFTGPVYQKLNVMETFPGGHFIGLGQDIRAVQHSGGNLSDAALIIAEGQTGVSGTPTYEDFNAYRAGGASNTIFAGYSFVPQTTTFISAYLDTFIRHPKTMIQSILCRMDCIWDIKTGVDGEVINCAFTNNSFNGYGFVRHENILTKLLSKAVNLSTKSVFMALCWRVGSYIALAVLCLYVLALTKNRKNLLLIIPILSFILALMLSCGWISFRYFQPLVVLSIIFVLTTITLLSKDENRCFLEKHSNE